jgi:hypothetical protein
MFATASHLGRRVISALGLISLAIETGQGFSRQPGHGKSRVANVVDDFPMFSHVVFLHLKMDLANLKQL